MRKTTTAKLYTRLLRRKFKPIHLLYSLYLAMVLFGLLIRAVAG